MGTNRRIAIWLIAAFIFHQVRGMPQLCKSVCTKEVNGEEGRTGARSKILFEACSVGCRMGHLDALLAWPSTVDGENCLKSCQDAFTKQEDQWACCVGCNATSNIDTPDDFFNEEEATTSAPSSYSSFFSFLYHAFFPSFFSFTKGNSMEITMVTVDGSTDSSGDGVERSYIYIVGGNADNPITTEESNQLIVPNKNKYKLDTDWDEWGDHDDDGEDTSRECSELWFTIQIISIALILLSLIFCCYYTRAEPTDTREREIVNCKEEFELEKQQHPTKILIK